MTPKLRVLLGATGGLSVASLLLGICVGWVASLAGPGAGSKSDTWTLPEISAGDPAGKELARARFDASYRWDLDRLRDPVEEDEPETSAAEEAAALAAAEAAAEAARLAAESAQPTWRFVGTTREQTRGDIVALLQVGANVQRYLPGDSVANEYTLVAVSEQSIEMKRGDETAVYALFHTPVPLD